MPPPYLKSIPLLNTFALDPSPQFAISDAFIDAVSETGEQEIVVLAVVGEGRSGKSTFLNYVVGSLIFRGLANLLEEDLAGLRDTNAPLPFETGNSVDPVTRGIEALLVPLKNGKMLLMLEVEGLYNREHVFLDTALAMVSQLTDHIIFMDRNLSDNFRNSVGRLVGACLMNSTNPTNVVWPRLHVVLNMSRISVDNETLTRAFSSGDGVSDETSQVVVLYILFLALEALEVSCLLEWWALMFTPAAGAECGVSP